TTFSLDKIRRFKREFLSIKKLRHPNIVEVYETGLHGNKPYFTMEFVDGVDLRSLLRCHKENRPYGKDPKRAGRSQAPLPERIEQKCAEFGIDPRGMLVPSGNGESSLTLSPPILELFLQICDALDYIHQHQIVHRDIKPENILITQGEEGLRIKLLDFGIVKQLHHREVTSEQTLTQHGVVLGSVVYVSPEQAKGLRVDARSDLYSFGIILYELVTGAPPFRADSNVAVLIQHVQETPRPPRQIDPNLSPRLERLILKLLAKDPHDRYPSAKDLKEAIEHLAPHAVEDLPPVVTPQHEEEGISFPLLQPTLVGRSRPLRELERNLDRCRRERGPVTFLVAEAGLGKSRLLEEFKARITVQGVEIYEGRCQQDHLSAFPFADILRSYLYHRRFQEEKIAEELGENARYLKAIVPELENYAFLHPHENSPEDRELLPQKIMESFARFLAAISEKRPVVVILEDFHASDPDQQEFLEFLLTHRTPGTMFCITLREEELAGSLRTLFVTLKIRRPLVIRLFPLTLEESKEMIFSMLGSEDLPERFLDFICENAEGNPLFIEEMVRNAVEKGDLFREAGQWHWRGIITSELPKGMEEVLARRVHSLSKNAQEILSVASALGSEFAGEILARVVRKPEEECFEALNELLFAQFLEEIDIRDEDAYRFKHNNVRLMMYQRLSPQRKQIVHRRIARVMEDLYWRKGLIDAACGEVALHYERGGERDKAIDYFSMAAMKARTSYQLHHGIRYYKQALSLLPKDDERVGDLLTGLADLYDLSGDPKRALKYYRRAVVLVPNDEYKVDILGKMADICEGKGETKQALAYLAKARKMRMALSEVPGPMIARLEAVYGKIHANRGDYGRAMSHYEKGLEHLSRKNRSSELAMLLSRIGQVCYSKGNYQEALSHLEESLEIYRHLLDDRGIGDTCNQIGKVYRNLGNFEKSLKFHRESLAVRERIGDVVGTAQSLIAIGSLEAMQSRLAQALEDFQRARDIVERSGDLSPLAQVYNNIGEVHAERGDYAQALEAYLKTLKQARKIGDNWMKLMAYFNISRVFKAKRNFERALAYLERSRKIVEVLDAQNHFPDIYILLSEIHAERHETEKAFEYSRKALQIAKRSGSRLDQGCALRAIGYAYDCADNPKEAHKYYTRSIVLFSEIGYEIEIAHTHERFGGMLLRTGRRDLGLRHIERAQEIYSRWEAKEGLRRIERLLSLTP
ncbi:MAG: tetratricopeptide repeat protein, partial [Deltaproteobacteria bacterium]